MSNTIEQPMCRLIKTPIPIKGRQGFDYTVGISAESVGACAIHLQKLVIPPGARAKANKHAVHETAIYAISGVSAVWHGPQLEHETTVEADHFFYIPADTPHLPFNPSDTVPAVVIIARTDTNAQESVELMPELDDLHPVCNKFLEMNVVTKILILGIAASVLSMMWAPHVGAVPSSAVSRSGPTAGPTRFASPLQPWVSPDGNVHLLRPIAAVPATTEASVSTLISPGWRLTWDGSSIGPGQPVVKLILKVRPTPPLKTASEILQIGVSRASDVVHSCLTYGLKGGSGQRQSDRLINGRNYVVWTNGDAGMSQQVTAIDLRAVVNGACYAIDRLHVSESGSDGDPAVSLPEATGAQELDVALSSLQLGPMAKDQVLRPQTVRTPPGTYAR